MEKVLQIIRVHFMELIQDHILEHLSMLLEKVGLILMKSAYCLLKDQFQCIPASFNLRLVFAQTEILVHFDQLVYREPVLKLLIRHAFVFLAHHKYLANVLRIQL